MRCLAYLVVLSVGLLSHAATAQTADEVSALIARLVELDSIDIAKAVKFRSGIEPPLHAVDADESGMQVLANPYEVHGRDKPGAAGWYRVTFTVPDKLGKLPVPPRGFNLGVESNCLGSWEIYTYVNGKPTGTAMAPGVRGVSTYGTMLAISNQAPTVWMSNAPVPAKPGDKITVAILATSFPLGRGSPDGFALRHLRLRFALAHTAARQPFYGEVTSPGRGTGLHGAREMLATLKGDELTQLQARLKAPLERLSAVFAAVDSGNLDDLSNAMKAASKEINDALRGR